MFEKYGSMNRRDFLKNSTIAAVGAAIASANPIEASSHKGNPKQINEGPVYEKTKKVWDLSREAWYPERYKNGGFYSGVVGILNLESKGNGHYLRIRSDEITSYHPKNGPTLELIAVNGIDEKIARGIDKCLANLWLKYTPPMEGVDQDHIKEIEKVADKHSISITPTITALFAIWEKNILGYAKEHKLPVLKLASAFVGLGNLYSAGIGENGQVPEYSRSEPYLRDFADFPLDTQKLIIENVYVPILTKTIQPLEKEIERIKSIRSDKEKMALEKKIEEEIIAKRSEENRRGIEARDFKKLIEEKRFNQTIQKILEYPIQ